jgi:hypothetical protein
VGRPTIVQRLTRATARGPRNNCRAWRRMDRLRGLQRGQKRCGFGGFRRGGVGVELRGAVHVLEQNDDDLERHLQSQGLGLFMRWLLSEGGWLPPTE